MSLKLLPSESMPREKLLTRGPQSLSDAELLAIFLRTGTQGMNVLELSDFLLRESGSLRALFSASKDQFCAHKGLGEAKYVQLQAVLEMTQRYLAETLKRGGALTSPHQTKLYLSSVLRDRQREAFYILFLDNQHRVIQDEVLFEGTIDAASVYPREVVKRALHHNAAALILAHNHPSGIAEPSQSDRRITQRLIDALALVDIRVLDHFVVGDGEVISFAERGWI
ncbi:JAB domain-containing protein [Vibrio cincinnatiensis]|jgi:DNA repair protein RadC|uniref:DNA repair protein RadC n=1 Tax=Vibrio cincinnatiensis DSM 19608 TaxID=1123491 RepID=A0A1T4RE92_VIBCI|nr:MULTISPECIES: DNA repair protein RadC [Vibrio]EGS63227.1 DNA repair RadC family protein [Vibrio paracholerae HE-09]EKA3900689.1 DNA repair protein RadC [Vibrio cholerae]MBW5416921.1 DNA repair protein RadC [Vibrio cholerae]MCG3726932.1 JAB domain-containing protein [Vibrio cincinnatiensis]MCG3736724.1 JAB domain-containing protein [Vibrio cincinnatiensis]